ncbi:hypothetical protein ACFLV7_04170 [Chloroflexota bacterium]
MIKVQILTKCTHCNGAAHLPVGVEEDHNGERYMVHRPCPVCQGSGNMVKWISMAELALMLEETTAHCPHSHTSLNGGFHFTEGDVWDNLIEVCNDCGANLDKQ